MDRVVSQVTVKKSKENVQVIGYSKTDRGTRFVNGTIEIYTKDLSPADVDAATLHAIMELLEPQLKVT